VIRRVASSCTATGPALRQPSVGPPCLRRGAASVKRRRIVSMQQTLCKGCALAAAGVPLRIIQRVLRCAALHSSRKQPLPFPAHSRAASNVRRQVVGVLQVATGTVQPMCPPLPLSSSLHRQQGSCFRGMDGLRSIATGPRSAVAPVLAPHQRLARARPRRAVVSAHARSTQERQP
jgi:hypothetical protein